MNEKKTEGLKIFNCLNTENLYFNEKKTFFRFIILLKRFKTKYFTIH